MPALLDLVAVSEFLGQPLSSVRRWIHRPPEGFPPVLLIGKKICIRAAQLEQWARGEVSFNREASLPGPFTEVKATAAASELPGKRRRGRPRKLQIDSRSAG
jgi:hypothetical protein